MVASMPRPVPRSHAVVCGMPKTCVVIGAGPGLGAAVARRFAQEEFAVAVVARNEATVSAVAEQIAEAGGMAKPYTADTTDPASVAALFERIRAELGGVDVLVYNAGAFVMGGILELAPAQFESAWRANCFGAFLCAREAVGGMLERKAGTLIFTGATGSLRGGAKFAALAVGKFGLRALAQSLARELGPQGVHVAHVVIDGQIASPRFTGRAAETLLAPEAIAESYWQLHTQDRTAWTQELDLRPAVEKF
jgi:NAD(P)-dependent dehydrogenase (short-subunit alcohol dehydrogenase family)